MVGIKKLIIVLSFFCLIPGKDGGSVFIDEKDASMFLSRKVRSASRMESECYEEICSWEELREMWGPSRAHTENDKIRSQCQYYDPCFSQGTSSCTNRYRGYTCSCRSGFGGTNCNDINECNTSPCLNSGTCRNTVGSYTCYCRSGFGGTNCNDINECNTSPCLNRGTCRNTFGSYSCSCRHGFYGSTCQEFDECVSSPCVNGGSCTDRTNDFQCSCAPGYTSKTCATEINECASNPCANNGTCTDLINDFRCACVPGYTGKSCSIDIDECTPIPCENGATCVDLVNDYSCTCVPGYTDAICSTDIDDCASDPCENKANCSDLVNDFSCSCVTGYTGKNCSIDIDDCVSGPCENNGNCTDLVNDFNCTCVSGYVEKNCSVDFDDCLSDPCENGGNCTDLVDDFECACEAGYTSKNCSVDIDECALDPCKNEATCEDLINDYICECVIGYEDKNCFTDIDDCESKPCRNNGNCSDLVNDYSCACVMGYTDKNCSTDIDDCASQPCNNNGTCSDRVDDFSCRCAIGFTDKDCSTNIDDCKVGLCSNGGTCEDLIADYHCICLSGYAGINCTIDVDECASSPCINDGNCTDLINDYSCTCKAGYTDKNCSTDINDCVSIPCLYESPCVDLVNDYQCECHSGYIGKNCETEPDICKTSHCHQNAVCLPESSTSFTCKCKAGFEGDGDECEPYCPSMTIQDAITNTSFTFRRVSLYESSPSNENCSNGRPIATATCLPHGNMAKLRKLEVLPCNVDLKAVTANIAQLKSSLITTTLVSSSVNNLKMLTSHDTNFSSSQARGVAGSILALSQTNREKVEIYPETVSNVLAVISVVGRTLNSLSGGGLANEKQKLLGALQGFADRVKLPADKSTLTIISQDMALQVTEPKLVPGENSLNLTVDLPSINIQTALTVNPDVISTSGGANSVKQAHLDIVFEKETARQGAVPLKDNELKETVTRTQCVRWDKRQNEWTPDGCSLVLGSSPPECRCNELASFAMVVSSVVLPSSYVMGIFSYVGCSMSAVGLFLTATLYVAVKQLRQRKPTTFLVNMCICLLVSNIIFMVGSGETDSFAICNIVASMLHYFLLASWCWMTANAINMYQALVNVMKNNRDITTPALVISYLLPALIVMVTVGLTVFHFDSSSYTPDNNLFQSSYRARHVCWLHLYSLDFGFLLPVGIMVLINCGLFLLVLRSLTCKRAKVQSSAEDRTSLGDFMIAVAIIAMMGVTWVFGFFMMISEDVIYQSIMAWLFTIFNSTQGLMIFYVNCIRQPCIRNIWLKPLRRVFANSDDETTQTSISTISRPRMSSTTKM